MRAPTASNHLQRPSRRLQLVVWAVLAVLVAVGFALTETSGSGYAEPLAESPAQTVAAPASIVAASGVRDPNGVLDDYYGATGTKDTIELLPAWRWQGGTGMYDALNTVDVGNFVSAIAGIFYSFASFLWMILLGILKFSAGLDLVHTAARVIDAAFASVTNNIWNSGVLMILIAVALFIGLKMVIKGQTTKALGLILSMLMPVAFMQAMATQVDPVVAGDTKNTDYSSPAGAPSWMAAQGVELIDYTAEGLGTGFGASAGVAGLGSVAAAQEGGPSCYAYNQVLYNQYKAFTDPGQGPTKDQVNKLVAGGDAANQTRQELANQVRQESYNQRLGGNVPVVSYLWERAFLRYWSGGQLGDSAVGERVACHLLEHNSDISPREQAAVAVLADGYPMVTKDGGKVGEGKPAHHGMFMYPDRQGPEFESRIAAWAACSYVDGAWKETNKAWGPVGGEVTSDICTDRWKDETGDVDGVLEYGTQEDYEEAFDPSKAVDDTTVASQLEDNRNFFDALRGDNAATRFLNGLMAFVTALFYMYALGAVAVGTIIAQLGVVLLLILLPATLTLLALPTQGKGRHPSGKKLLRLTGAFLAAKLVLTVVMTLLINTIAIFESLLGAMGNAMNGLIHAVIPLVALFLIRFLMKQAGLGNLTSLSGAVGMASAGALGASGDSNGRGLFSGKSAALAAAKADTLGNRLGVNRADAFAKKQAKRAGLAAPKAAGFGAKAAAGALGLDSMKALATGRKNELGERTQLGMAQRLGARAAALGYGMAGKALGVDENGNPVGRRGLPGSRLAAGHVRRLQGRQITRGQMAKMQMDEQKAHLAATFGKSAEGRRIAAANRFADIEAAQAARTKMRNLGMSEKEIEATEIRSQGPGKGVIFTDNKGFGHIIKPGPIAPDQVRADFLNYADSRALNEAQAVANQLGLGATYVPVPRGNSATAQLVRAKTEEGTIELAKDGMQYVPDDVKARKAGWSDDQYSTYLHGVSRMIGAYDPVTDTRVDFAKEHGIDLTTEAGKLELRKAMNGEPSAFDSLQGTIEPDPAQLAALVARVSKMGRGADESYEKQLKAAGGGVRAVANQVQVQITEKGRDSAKEATNNVQAHKAALTMNVDQIKQIEDQVAERHAQVQKVEVDLTDLKAQLANMAADAPDRSKKEAEVQRFEVNLEKARTAAAEAEAKAALRQETMKNEMQEAITKMMEESMEAIGRAAQVHADSMELTLNHEMFLAGKKGKDLSPIMEKAEDFEKQFPGLKAGMENQLFAAQTALMNAYNEGNHKAIRAAAEDLDRQVRRTVAQADQLASKAMGEHMKLQAEQVQEFERELVNNLRYGQGTEKKIRASELMGSGAPLPR